MKKFLALFSSLGLALILAACGNEETTNQSSEKESTNTEQPDSNEQSEPAKEESKYPFPEDTTPIGDSLITITTPSGDSSNGNIPVLYVEQDAMLVQIGIDYEKFDGSRETFIYINEMFLTAEQFGEMGATTLNLEQDQLKPGDYTVTAVQFENNDPKQKPTHLVQAKYEIKEQS